jgi:hypothetical protein
MAEENPIATPVCIHLRTKKMYYQEGDTTADPGMDSHPYFWCMVTMGQIGPDDDRVTAQFCRPGRSCFAEFE